MLQRLLKVLSFASLQIISSKVYRTQSLKQKSAKQFEIVAMKNFKGYSFTKWMLLYVPRENNVVGELVGLSEGLLMSMSARPLKKNSVGLAVVGSSDVSSVGCSEGSSDPVGNSEGSIEVVG